MGMVVNTLAVLGELRSREVKGTGCRGVCMFCACRRGPLGLRTTSLRILRSRHTGKRGRENSFITPRCGFMAAVG